MSFKRSADCTRSSSCTPVYAAALACFTWLIELASEVTYWITAGIICLLAISIMERASMLIAFEYASYLISARDSSSARLNTSNFSNISTALSYVRHSIDSTMVLIFGSPLLSASFTHSSEYPLPLNTIL